jgi:hypothetical protein
MSNDDDIDDAIDTLVRACNVENRERVTQMLRKLVDSGGETSDKQEGDLKIKALIYDAMTLKAERMGFGSVADVFDAAIAAIAGANPND